MYTYTWYQWLAFFYIYCFFGWVFESTYVSLKKKQLVNRGFLRIPMLPLYGSGAVMMLWVSLPVKNNLFLVYLSGVIAATALEYVTGSLMERLFKVRYWDYSNQKFQLQGYICLSSSVAWGFLTILMTEVIHQPISEIVVALNQHILLFCVILITIVFVSDTYESTKTALALGKSLETMTKLKNDIEDLQERVATLKEEAAEHVYMVKEDTAARLAAVKTRNRVRVTFAKAETTDMRAFAARNRRAELLRLVKQLADVRAKRNAILSRSGLRHFYRKSLLKGNPGAVSSRFAAALKELRDEIGV
ncbi:MAG: hypothetical protein RSC13_00885, partial [Clostridium sp.]